jgi:hypothetical protein
MPRTCAIILNWNRWRDTLECLESLCALKPGIKTIIVCDNGSSDGSRENIPLWAEKRYGAGSILKVDHNGCIPQNPSDHSFVYIQNQTNLGFAAGNNAGIRVALAIGGFDFIWILNNDTIADQRAVETLLAYAKAHLGVGIFGSTVVLADRPGILQCAGGCRFNPLTTIYRPALGGKRLDAVLSGRDLPRLDYIYGAAMLVRTEVFEKIGLFNEAYFLFYEEIDLCRRAQNAGFFLGWCPRSIIYHKNSRTVGRRGAADKKKIVLANYHENLSTLIFTKKFYPALLLFVLVFRLLGKLVFIAGRGDWYLIDPLLRAYRDFFRQRVAIKKSPDLLDRSLPGGVSQNQDNVISSKSAKNERR